MNRSSAIRIAALVGLCATLCGCGGLSATELTDVDYNFARAGRAPAPAAKPLTYPDADDSDASDIDAPATVGAHLQCVPYARAHSTVDIHGDAYTWWDKAAGIYARGETPIEGSVVVMAGYAGDHRAHVAVVSRIVSARRILIDHANWLNDGAIYVNDPVLDVSPNNDWSQVKVWNIRTGAWGVKIYYVRGFIGPNRVDGNAVVASYQPRPWDDAIARQIAATGDDLDDTDQ
jgi:hypothetical protein